MNMLARGMTRSAPCLLCVVLLAACSSTTTGPTMPSPPSPTPASDRVTLPPEVASTCASFATESLPACVAVAVSYVYKTAPGGHRFSGVRYNDRCWTTPIVRAMIARICAELHRQAEALHMPITDDHCDGHSSVSLTMGGDDGHVPPHIVQVRAVPILEPNTDCRFLGLDWYSYLLVHQDGQTDVSDDSVSVQLGGAVSRVIDSN
jgi:hypothetical protein